jgi:uncharacterized protein YjbJ (UPF0337 family)
MRHRRKGGTKVMGEKIDKTKGRAKEAAGDLTGNDRLKREGKIDQASGSVKGAAEKTRDKVAEGVDAVKRHAHEANDG